MTNIQKVENKIKAIFYSNNKFDCTMIDVKLSKKQIYNCLYQLYRKNKIHFIGQGNFQLYK